MPWKRNRNFRVAPLVLAMLVVAATSALAQVPQDLTFSGRLVDDLGAPLVGPLEIVVDIFDAETGGTRLYSDDFFSVPLDAEGNFAVRLGTASYAGGGTFDASVFAGGDRWVEVRLPAPGPGVLSPRVPLSSVPYALIAQQIEPDPSAPRFEDCGDGTVADRQTGLQWEQKTGTPTGPPYGPSVDCVGAVVCPDPHDLNNRYSWTDVGLADANGRVFTDFLERLNGEFDPLAATGCFAGRCDWRLPTISELQTILTGPDAAPGQPPTCNASTFLCIDPDFAAIGGPTFPARHWSSSDSPEDVDNQFAWTANFGEQFNGELEFRSKGASYQVRAVRTGSCN